MLLGCVNCGAEGIGWFRFVSMQLIKFETFHHLQGVYGVSFLEVSVK